MSVAMIGGVCPITVLLKIIGCAIVDWVSFWAISYVRKSFGDKG